MYWFGKFRTHKANDDNGYVFVCFLFRFHYFFSLLFSSSSVLFVNVTYGALQIVCHIFVPISNGYRFVLSFRQCGRRIVTLSFFLKNRAKDSVRNEGLSQAVAGCCLFVDYLQNIFGLFLFLLSIDTNTDDQSDSEYGKHIASATCRQHTHTRTHTFKFYQPFEIITLLSLKFKGLSLFCSNRKLHSKRKSDRFFEKLFPWADWMFGTGFCAIDSTQITLNQLKDQNFVYTQHSTPISWIVVVLTFRQPMRWTNVWSLIVQFICQLYLIQC